MDLIRKTNKTIDPMENICYWMTCLRFGASESGLGHFFMGPFDHVILCRVKVFSLVNY